VEIETPDQLIGAAYLYLKGLGYMLPLEKMLPVYDQEGESQGNIRVQIYPSIHDIMSYIMYLYII
jgi:hypothetical protein